LSLNKCFEKIENPLNGSKKGCLWGLNPQKFKKVEEECKKYRQRDLVNIRLSMSRPEDLNKIERGEQILPKKRSTSNTSKTESNGIAANENNNELLGLLMDDKIQGDLNDFNERNQVNFICYIFSSF
jgi:hypothetical protein